MTDEKDKGAAQAASSEAQATGTDHPEPSEFDRRKARALAADRRRRELLAKGVSYQIATAQAEYETRDVAPPETRK